MTTNEEADALITKNPISENEQLNEHADRNEQAPKSQKKPFVEPSVSVPVDVLEATTFFQQPSVESAVIS